MATRILPRSRNLRTAAAALSWVMLSPALFAQSDSAPVPAETTTPPAAPSTREVETTGMALPASDLGESERVSFTHASLTVSEALRSAWTTNPQVMEAQHAIEAAGYDRTGSYAGFLPSIQISNLTGNDSVSSIQASLPLWRGGLTLAQIRASEAREIMARANLDKVRLDIGRQTLAAFHGMAQAQEQLSQSQRYIDALSGLYATIQRRLEQGVARESEVNTATSRIQQARVDQEIARLQLMNNRNELQRLLQAYPEQVALQGAQDILKAVLPIDSAKAVENHPEVLIAAARVAEQIELAKQARAQLSPEVAVQYRHYYGGGQAFDDTADEPQLVVQYQLGNTFAALQKKRAEETRAEAARSALESAKRVASSQLNATRQQVASSQQQVALQEQASASTQALVDSFLRQYQAGNRSWIEVLNAQREAHQSALGLIASRRSLAEGEQQLALQSLNWGVLTR